MRSENNLTKKPKSCTAAYVKAVFGSRIHEEKGDKHVNKLRLFLWFPYHFPFPLISPFTYPSFKDSLRCRYRELLIPICKSRKTFHDKEFGKSIPRKNLNASQQETSIK